MEGGSTAPAQGGRSSAALANPKARIETYPVEIAGNDLLIDPEGGSQA